MNQPDRDIYETLDVDPSADEATIRRAFLRKAKQHHPDVGCDENEFKAVQLAY